MIYAIIFIFILFYLFFLFRNIGESSKVSYKNRKLISVVIVLLFLVISIFVKDSGITNHEEYESILDKHSDIRKNISTIKKNIPILSERLNEEKDYYQGWVMLAKSYIITDDISQARAAYEKALSLNADDPIIIEEYISVLIKLDPKSNKKEILKSFDQLLSLDSLNLNIYNMKLNYSIDLNDAELTKKILKDIISNQKIQKKQPYIAALNQMESSGLFNLKIIISETSHATLTSFNYVFFILKEDKSNIPFAVMRFKNNELPFNFIINTKNKMIVDAPIPKELRLYIKGSSKPSVDKNMKTIYESEVIDILDLSEYNIN
jgi:tetratricopeptide (TPR) repeat protein